VILIVSNARDLTTDFVVLELQRRDLAYVRLNAEDLPRATVRFGVEAADDWSIDLFGRRIAGPEISAGYFRRPGAPEPDKAIAEPAEHSYCAAEWAALLRSLYPRLGGRWLNSPTAIAQAEDKPGQLILARTLGFDVPETLVTNDLVSLETFLQGPPAVAKPLRHALLDGDVEKVIFTSRIDKAVARDARAVAAAPFILQREIVKQVDLRVTVVGERVFAAAIHSQESVDAEVDWRQGAGGHLRHEAVHLPGEVAARCIALVKALGLGFGAIDLVLGRDGRHWFLEINPNGQWAWIESRTAQPIAAAIVEELERKAAT
jgi:glutathione synthase/RimK-type ligase-like ATP-grasp enzyme